MHLSYTLRGAHSSWLEPPSLISSREDTLDCDVSISNDSTTLPLPESSVVDALLLNSAYFEMSSRTTVALLENQRLFQVDLG